MVAKSFRLAGYKVDTTNRAFLKRISPDLEWDSVHGRKNGSRRFYIYLLAGSSKNPNVVSTSCAILSEVFSGYLSAG